MKRIFIDTCGLPRCQLESAKIYREAFKDRAEIGFELLPMFDMPDFEPNLAANLDFLREGPVCFHEPVFFVEHSAPKGSLEYEQSMHHIMLTKKYAEILQPSHMVYHISNCLVAPEKKAELLRTSLINFEEMRELFAGVTLLVENVGTDAKGDKLLDQQEFTDMCRAKNFDVLIDIGHANANSWDLKKLITDLKTQIRAFHLHNNDGVHDLHNRITDGTMDFPEILRHIRAEVPEADLVIEYISPKYHGKSLMEDIETLCSMM